jgi:hypothetical protein
MFLLAILSTARQKVPALLTPAIFNPAAISNAKSSQHAILFSYNMSIIMLMLKSSRRRSILSGQVLTSSGANSFTPC